MVYYTIYVGGERKDRVTTEEDIANVQKTLTLMDTGRCYTKLYDGERFIGQAEHVLPALVAISYIASEADVDTIKQRLASVGVTTCTVVTCSDAECLNEVDYYDVTLPAH